MCVDICVCLKGGARTLQQRKARKEMNEETQFYLVQISGKSKTRKCRFLCMQISKKWDIGERFISLSVFRCGSCQLETS